MSSDKGQLTPEQTPDFEKAEMDLFRESLRLSYIRNGFSGRRGCTKFSKQ